MLIGLNGDGSSRKCIKYNVKFDVSIVMAVNDVFRDMLCVVCWLLGQYIKAGGIHTALWQTNDRQETRVEP
jgi:hypothetical protein